MGDSPSKGRLEQVAAAALLIDVTDYGGIANLHTSVEALAESLTADGQAPELAAITRKAAGLLEAIALEESRTPQATLDAVLATLSALQRVLRDGTPVANAEFPAEVLNGQTEGPAIGAIELLPVADARIVSDFLARQGSVLEHLEELVLGLEQPSSQSETQHADLRRLLHTLKGEAALLCLEAVERVCHSAEDFLGRAKPSEITDALLEVKDWLGRSFEAIAAGASPPNHSPLISRLAADPTLVPPAAVQTGFMIGDIGLAPDFVTEATEHLDAADQHLLTLESNPDSADALHAVFRAFHTLKGGAGMVGLSDIQAVAHEAESLLDKARKGTVKLVGPSIDVTFETVDMLKRMVAGVREFVSSGRPPDPEPGRASLIARLSQASTGAAADSRAAAVRPAEPSHRPADEQPAAVRSIAPVIQIKETVKVDADRLDRLVDTIGELVIAESMVCQSPELLSVSSTTLARHMNQLDKITRELQEMATSLRMIPLRSTFQKMARLVRDLAKKSGKPVDFVTAGEDTELDKTVVDGISDPLVHMVRNAVDHGIESDPSERTTKGKARTAKVELRAFHKGGNIFIQLQDDGRGMDKEAILAKARDRGVLRETETLTDREIWNLIFTPGLSTAKKITEVSGRGVGMDVVKRSIDSLRGTVEIKSEAGAGTTFTIKLPLTLAIIDGMVVRTGRERYIVPTLSVVRSLRPAAHQMSTVLGRGELLSLPEGLVPLVRLSRVFDITAAIEDPEQALVIIVEDDGHQVGFLVDELLGQQQIVIKNLGDSIGSMPGVAGGAIMADGRVGLILDVGGLVRLASESTGTTLAAA